MIAARNRLLSALSAEDLALLEPHLTPLTTHLHQPLAPPHQPIEQLFFPLSGFASVTNGNGSHKVETGLIGSEGLVGVPILLGSYSSPLDHFVQVAGEMLSIKTDAFVAAVERSVSTRNLFLRYAHTLLIQTAQTAMANASFGVENRLARWLLMCQDRLGDSLTLTHEFLSMMLGVQRTSVTLALQTLEGNGLIRARRGRIEVRNREMLIELAHSSYGVPEAEYARLIGKA